MAVMVLNGLIVSDVTNVKAAKKKWTVTYQGGAYDKDYVHYSFAWSIKNTSKKDVYVDDICVKSSSGKKICTWKASTIKSNKTLNKTFVCDFSKLSSGYYTFSFNMYDNKRAKKESFSSGKIYNDNKRIRFVKLTTQEDKAKRRTYNVYFRVTEMKGKLVSFKIYNASGKCVTTMKAKNTVPNKDCTYRCWWTGNINNKQYANGVYTVKIFCGGKSLAHKFKCKFK